ncbi:DNA-binding protein Ewg isoform X2 [Anopheles stephensi]|uniref:DNA-binding protein Ewg isoform X2 n=1 Tax=Anopheles stephensi TaxID=30069 RepID=UPI00165897AE|nr:DNA-binding protein Ewg isoform X2 [Anopheles stephensi]
MSLTINAVDAMEYVEDDNITGASDDDDDDNPSSPGSAYDDGNLINVAMENEVTAQLVAAGVVGVAAAAAITSSKKKKRPHSFETNPSIRKRQQNRLLRKLRQTIFEYATRVGQQAVVLVATPGKPNNIYKVFGAKPLEDVLKNLRNNVMDKLDEALAAQAPPRVQDDPSLFELPPLIIDGIPTPVEKMTQAQLRAFIPLMLKYSTGRGKPGWGRDSTRPPWWPKELPWANVRMDARTEEEKQKISWTHALRKIVINCYKYHGREDLLPAFSEEDEKANAIATASSNVDVMKIENGSVVTVGPASNGNTTTATITNSAGGQQQIIIHQAHPQQQQQQQQQGQTNGQTTTTITSANGQIIKENPDGTIQIQQQSSPTQTLNAQFTHTVLQTIQNPDGTVSLIQVDPNNPIITLPDGTTAQVQGIATLQPQGDGGVHAIQTISDGQGESMSVDLTEATLGQDGQLIITGEDGQGFPVNVSGMITVPVSAQMYQTMMANIQQVPNVDGTVCITPMQVHNIAQQQQQQTSSGVSTANTTTQNLTISTNVGAGNQHHHATAMLTNYTLSSNGALLAVPQMQQHLVPSTGKHQRGAGGSSNNGVSRSSAPSVGLPMVGLNAILPSQRGCFNISTTGHQEADASNPNLNNNNHSTTLTQHALNVHRKANVIPTGGNTILGGGAGIAANQVKFCIPKIEPMDEDKDGSVVSGDANGTPSFVIQLSGIPFTTADPKSAHQQQQLKRDIELTVNEGSHLIDALSISQKVNSNSSNSSSSSNNAPNDVDQKHFGLQSV